MTPAPNPAPSSSRSPVQEEDYQLWDARDREDTRKGKGFMYVGALLGLGGVGYMARNFKNRPKDMKVSVYLIHTRLVAQGTVIGVLCLGMLNEMYKNAAKKYDW